MEAIKNPYAPKRATFAVPVQATLKQIMDGYGVIHPVQASRLSRLWLQEALERGLAPVRRSPAVGGVIGGPRSPIKIASKSKE
jgi:hypothetical protein